MAEHPIDKRAEQMWLKDRWENPSLSTFTEILKLGYDTAVADHAKRLAAAESCVEYLRTLAEANDFPTASKKLVAAYDDAVKEAGNGQS